MVKEKKLPMMEIDEPKKRILMWPCIPVTVEDSGSDTSTAQSPPCNASHSLDQFPYHLIPIVMEDVSNLAFTMEGMETVTREHLDNELLKLATISVPDQDDPTSQVERDNYIKMARALGPRLFEIHKEVAFCAINYYSVSLFLS